VIPTTRSFHHILSKYYNNKCTICFQKFKKVPQNVRHTPKSKPCNHVTVNIIGGVVTINNLKSLLLSTDFVCVKNAGHEIKDMHPQHVYDGDCHM
jgi:hypothetical protein